jgi:CubicO group peptidase (beta-lactamase class C family)
MRIAKYSYKAFCIAFSLLLFAGWRISAQTKFEELETFIIAEMKAKQIPALSAAIIKDGKIAWAKGFGKQGKSNNIPVSENALFPASSIAKIIVAVAVMQQYEKGKIDLDADISKYLGYTLRNPNFRDIVITPRLLLTHQAGLTNPDFSECAVLAEFYTDTVINIQSWLQDYLAETGKHYTPALWKNIKPGTVHLSANLGVTILAHLVEKVTGKNFRNYCDTYIFSKLGMKNTGYKMNRPGLFNDSLLVELEFETPGKNIFNSFEKTIYPATLMRTSINDWSKFLIAILNSGQYMGKRILKKTTVNEMLDVKYPNANLAFNSGVALMWRSYGPANDWLGHTGGGFIAASTDINVKQKIGVIIFSNGRDITVMPGGGLIYEKIHAVALSL